MDLQAFVEGPLLWAVFVVFLVGILVRITLFLIALMGAGRPKAGRGSSFYTILGRSLVPFHMGAMKKPFYAALRYLFHLCLVVVPIWLAGHVVLWSESRFGWEWATLPDGLADLLTVLTVGLALYFFISRIAVSGVRRDTSFSDFLLLVITTLPFLSGYFLAHGTLDAIGFLGNNMRLIHVLSSEAMLVTAAFLFYRVRLNAEKCTGCAACESSCPTGTLASKDEGKIRAFFYSIYRCICCGACVKDCPEEAAELRHEISIRDFLRLFTREKIRSVELAVCEGCGALFAPELLLDRVGKTIIDDYRHYCSTCKKTRLAANFYKLAPWPKRKPSVPKAVETSPGIDAP